MQPWVADTEADGFLDEATIIHCIVLRRGREVRCYHDDENIHPWTGSIQEGLTFLEERTEGVVWHNGLGYDLPLIQKLWPGFLPPPVAMDTMVAARVAWPDTGPRDKKRAKEGKFPGTLVGKHTLEAWGHRMGRLKGDFKEESDFSTFTQGMLDYCIQDTNVGQQLYKRIVRENVSPEALALEHAFAPITMRQGVVGFTFDTPLSSEILRELQGEFANINEQAHAAYPAKVERVPYPSFLKTGKPWRGATHKTVTTEFNPGSRPQIAANLIAKGWVPEMMTEGGSPALSNEILGDLAHRYPECELFAARFDMNKRLSQLDHGDKSWLNHVREDGRIPAVAIHNGTVTARCRHMYVTSVPKKGVKYASRMRELFTVPEGRLLTGWDASGLEARIMAHYLARFDGGNYAKLVLAGDVHTLTVNALGPLLDNWEGIADTRRDLAKTEFYAWLFGAGDWKLGYGLGFDPGSGPDDRECEAVFRGRQARAALLKGVPGLEQLVTSIKKAIKRQGYLVTLDGRKVRIRSSHSGVNFAFQSGGAIVMKWATVEFHRILEEDHGLIPWDYGMDPLEAQFVQVGHWHDECQTEHDPDVTELVAAAGPLAMKRAGEHFKLRIPMTGEAKTGQRWSETH